MVERITELKVIKTLEHAASDKAERLRDQLEYMQGREYREKGAVIPEESSKLTRKLETMETLYNLFKDVRGELEQSLDESILSKRTAEEIINGR